MHNPLPACQGLLALCRAGSESDVEQELNDVMSTTYGVYGHARYQKDSGCVVWLAYTPITQYPTSHHLIFARQLIPLWQATPLYLDRTQRISPLLDALEGKCFSALYIDTPDSNDGKHLAKKLSKVQPALLSAAAKKGFLNRDAALRCHLVFTPQQTDVEGDEQVWLGFSHVGQTLKWPMGIPRLKMPIDAPSRSTLKLAEAFQFFLSPEEQQEWLREGLTAVDLGASPGGWTYQLVQHGLQVTAIDNGKMADTLMQTGQVEHLATDGFTYKPKRKVHWLVCDMIEQPSRVATLMADWLAQGDCQHALFNLKLPMKKRYAEVMFCLQLIEDQLQNSRFKLKRLTARQLYHDRDEVTVYAALAHQ